MTGGLDVSLIFTAAAKTRGQGIVRVVVVLVATFLWPPNFFERVVKFLQGFSEVVDTM